MVEEVDAVLFVEVKGDLGIRVRLEAMPSRFQILSQLDEVVELAVHDHGDGVVLVGHRLRPFRAQVDD